MNWKKPDGLIREMYSLLTERRDLRGVRPIQVRDVSRLSCSVTIQRPGMKNWTVRHNLSHLMWSWAFIVWLRTKRLLNI